jgi:nicotinic acid phosphoribosyltransferase
MQQPALAAGRHRQRETRSDDFRIFSFGTRRDRSAARASDRRSARADYRAGTAAAAFGVRAYASLELPFAGTKIAAQITIGANTDVLPNTDDSVFAV